MVSVAEKYRIERYSAADEPQVLALLQDALGEGVSQWEDGRLWRWKHFQNPFEDSYVIVAKDSDDRVLGVRALMRWNFTAGGRVYTAIRPVDTATRADCRGQGIFPALTKHGLADARNRGIDFMFNTPNALSRPGYLKMGWSLLTEAYPSYKVVDWMGFGGQAARGLVSRACRRDTAAAPLPEFADFSARRVASDDPRLRETLRQEREWQSRTNQMLVDRTAEYLVWRYAQDPAQDHWVVWSDSAAVPGFCVVRPQSTGLGPRTAVIEEMVLAQPDLEQVKRLLRSVRQAFGAHFLQAHFSPESFYGQALRRLGFRQVARNGMSVVVNPLSQDLDFDLKRLDRWALGMGELELF